MRTTCNTNPIVFLFKSLFCGSVSWSAIATPLYAADRGALLPEDGLWVLLWVTILLAVIFIGYLQQNRMVKKKTKEIRRELFERQTAEKELLDSEQKLRQSLAEKEALLKEIHHRVKNNLQIVSSLLYLQEDSMEDTKGIEILRESQNRVKSMALIHEQLYGTNDLAKIDFGRYLKGLTANLLNAYAIEPARIRMNVEADDISLGVDVAVPCGLIVNELVSNALKHAFKPQQGGTIDIVFQKLGAHRLQIVVKDDGMGMAGTSGDAKKQSLGLKLVDTLTTQLGGAFTSESDGGTQFTIVLNAPGRTDKEN